MTDAEVVDEIEPATSTEPQSAIEAPQEAPKTVADMTPQERQQACSATIQEVLRSYGCRLAIRMVTKPVCDPRYPNELLVTSEPHVLPVD